MKNYLITLGAMLDDALDEARDRKRRVRRRLDDMRGDFGSNAVRGPWRPGRPGVKWHLYQSARSLHARATQRVAALVCAIQHLEAKA